MIDWKEESHICINAQRAGPLLVLHIVLRCNMWFHKLRPTLHLQMHHYCISVTAACLRTDALYVRCTLLSRVLSGCLKQIVLYPIQSTVGPFLGPILHPGQTAAVAVVSFWASDKLRFRTLELLIVSKWDSGTQPRCRSESLVPSTQSVESKETNISYPCRALINT